MTRARDLLLFPRHRVRLNGDWLSPVAANVDLLPRFAPDEPRPSTPGAGPARPDTAQGRGKRGACQAEAIDVSRRRIVWDRPSRHKAPREAAAVPQDEACVVAPCGLDVPHASPRAPAPLDGAVRGMVLHKLLEEVLTGETAEHADAPVQARRRTAPANRARGLAPARRARPHRFCARSRFAKSRPSGPGSCRKIALYASRLDEANLSLTTGIADAVALDDTGRIAVVIDWKSDHSPVEDTLAVLLPADAWVSALRSRTARNARVPEHHEDQNAHRIVARPR